MFVDALRKKYNGAINLSDHQKAIQSLEEGRRERKTKREREKGGGEEGGEGVEE